VGLNEVLDIWRNALRPTHLHDDVGHGCRLRHEAQTAPIHSQATPRPARHPVSSTQGIRHGVFIPRRCGSNDLQVVRNLGAIAQRTGQRRANSLLACDVIVEPRGRPQRWTVPDMLTMEALQQRDPVAGLIVLETDDPTLHGTERTEVPTPAGLIPGRPILHRRSAYRTTQGDIRSPAATKERATNGGSGAPAISPG
jgi:hypothetical protein